MQIETFIKNLEQEYSLTSNGLTDAVFEIRFASEYKNFELLFGDFLKESFALGFSNPSRLPINDIPDVIVQQNPDLQFKPRWTVENDDYIVQIWHSVLIFSTKINETHKYPGWSEYSKKLIEVVEKVLPAIKVQNYTRIGMRYINFFKGIDVFADERLKINLNIDNNNINWKHYIQTKFTRWEYNGVLTISNSVAVTSGPKSGEEWSLIDIDAYTENSDVKNVTRELIEGHHSLIKDTFFSMVTENFINELN